MFILQKVVVIYLLYGYFCRNLTSQTFPSHVIHVGKQELLNFKELHSENNLLRRFNWTGSLIDFSKLENLSEFVY